MINTASSKETAAKLSVVLVLPALKTKLAPVYTGDELEILISQDEKMPKPCQCQDRSCTGVPHICSWTQLWPCLGPLTPHHRMQTAGALQWPAETEPFSVIQPLTKHSRLPSLRQRSCKITSNPLLTAHSPLLRTVNALDWASFMYFHVSFCFSWHCWAQGCTRLTGNPFPFPWLNLPPSFFNKRAGRCNLKDSACCWRL